MGIHERIKELRKLLNLTQEEFAKKLNISRANLGSIEVGRISVTDRVIKSICTTYGVNEDWLKKGIGETFMLADTFVLYQLKECFGLDDDDIRIVTTYARLPLQYRERFRNYMQLIVDHEVESYSNDINNHLGKDIVGSNENTQSEKNKNFTTSTPSLQEKADAYAKMLSEIGREEFLKEKKPDVQVFSAKESDAV